jgi:hypothetical protein
MEGSRLHKLMRRCSTSIYCSSGIQKQLAVERDLNEEPPGSTLEVRDY